MSFFWVFCVVKNNLMLTLVSRERLDNERQTISIEAARQSKALRRHQQGKLVHVNLSKETLAHVVTWLKHQETEPQTEDLELPFPLPKISHFESLVGEWNAHWIKSLSIEELMEVLKASKMLGMPLLMDLCCATIAFSCINKTPMQLRTYFKMPTE